MSEEEVYRIVTSVEKLSKIGYEALSDDLCVAFYYAGVLHRDDDEPAYRDFYDTKKWFKEGILHREKGPAKVFTSDGERLLVYCLEGVEITGKDREDFIKLIEASPEEVPLYINHPVLKNVAKNKLKEV